MNVRHKVISKIFQWIIIVRQQCNQALSAYVNQALSVYVDYSLSDDTTTLKNQARRNLELCLLMELPSETGSEAERDR